MESSPVVRGGVVLNKNKKFNNNSKNIIFKHAISLAIAGLILSPCNPAFAKDMTGGGNATGNYDFLNLNRGDNTATGAQRTYGYSSLSTTEKNSMASRSHGYIQCPSQLIANNANASIQTYSFTSEAGSLLHLGGSVDVGQFSSVSELNDFAGDLSIVARGQLRNWTNTTHDGSDEVTILGEANISGNTTFKNHSSVTAHKLAIGGSFNVQNTGDLILEGKDVSLFKDGTSNEVKGQIKVASATFTNAGNVKFLGASTFTSSV